MTRQPHDQFAKQYLEELLSPLGTVEVSREVTAEVRQIDVYFAPNSPFVPSELGLLGRLVTSSCLFEPYRNAPSQAEVRSCLLKLFALQTELERQRKRQKQSLKQDDLPSLWILASSVSANLLNEFEGRLDLKNWVEGVYFLAPAVRSGIIAINQLPISSDTLWLRLLGKGKTQEQAIEELLALSPNAPLRSQVLEQLASWRRNLELKERLTRQEQELIMTLTPAYLEWREETLQEGRVEGQVEEKRRMVENLLKVRFGELDAELLGAMTGLLALPTEDVAVVLMQWSKEEILAQFGDSNL